MSISSLGGRKQLSIKGKRVVMKEATLRKEPFCHAMIESPKSWQTPQDHMRALLTHPWYKKLAHIQSELVWASHAYFRKMGSLGLCLPITTGAISSPMGLGSDSLPVSIEVNNVKTYLADSMQFHLELACRLHKKPTYYVMPSFRGEPVDSRHLNEFQHAEVEIIGDQNKLIQVAENYILFITNHMLETCGDEIISITGSDEHLRKLLDRGTSFPRIEFDEALKILSGYADCVEAIETNDFRITSKGERHLIEKFGDFCWLLYMPASVVPFYQAIFPDGRRSKTGDLLAGIGEVLGSGERASSSQDVLNNLAAHHVDPQAYDWYVQMKTDWPLHTSGFGMGLERYVLWLLNHNDIRDCTLLLRDFSRVCAP